MGERQRVEIIKALYRGAALLILDEPTAVLTPQEVDDLFKTFHQMVADGHALIFISHKLHEVLAISDRISVLRDGRHVGHGPRRRGDQAESRADDGRSRSAAAIRAADQRSKPVRRCLKIEDLRATSDRGTEALRGVSLDVCAGEILGLAGVSGNGQRELAEVIFGLRPATGGTVSIEGQAITGKPPSALNRLGMSYIPEERMVDGVIKDFTVAENLILQDHGQPPYARQHFYELARDPPAAAPT